jgi:pimeloyl-ACP methyl ester carboxylesterase
MTYSETHSPYPIPGLPQWVLHVSHTKTRRLIVFVHGFGGHAVNTWDEFPQSGRIGHWWQEADMLFVGYASTKENATSVADRLNAELPNFYPRPFAPAMRVGEVDARDEIEPYEELLLVGHSLGGLIIRRALKQAAQQWVFSPAGTPLPAILNAQMRLFSPASAGFRPAGFAGFLKAMTGIWGLAELRLRMSSAYWDLQPSSSLIIDTRRETEDLFARTGLTALQARILWANPDNIVRAEEYAIDPYRSSAHGRTHVTVCKPDATYTRPWQFVETGT